MKTRRLAGLIATLTLAGAVVAAAAEADRLETEVGNAVRMFKDNPKIQGLFDSAYGYAVFPSVGKAGVGIGGAEGRGLVFERGAMVGSAKLIQGSVGAQLGAQSYGEVIFFESQRSLDEFKDGKTAVSAALSGALAADGAGAEAKYQHGVIVATMDRSGLMFEASVGGQHFKFTELSSAPAATPAPPAGSAAPPKTSEPPAAPPTQ